MACCITQGPVMQLNWNVVTIPNLNVLIRLAGSDYAIAEYISDHNSPCWFGGGSLVWGSSVVGGSVVEAQ
jgi:hypothetical protein